MEPVNYEPFTTNNHISKLNYLDSISNIVDKYNYYIFDMDGVLWSGPEIYHESIKTVNKLFKLNKKVFFLTNNNRFTRLELVKKLIVNGVSELNEKNIDLIFSSSFLLANHFKTHDKHIKKIYMIGTKALEEELSLANLEIVGGSRDSDEKLSLFDIERLKIDETIQACVCGFDDELNYYKLCYASQVIFQTNNFYGTNYDAVAFINRKIYPGSYAFITALEVTTSKKATIITKPDPRSLDIIMELNSIKKEEKNKILMIGDYLHTDILFANNGGIDSLLLFSGTTIEKEYIEDLKDEEKSSKLPKPTYLMKYLNY